MSTSRDLYERVLKSTSVPLSSDEQVRLDALKLQDPETWRKEINTHEQAYIDTKLKEFDEARTAEATANSADSEEQRRAQALANFNETNKVELTQDMIEYDVPKRLKDEFENLEDPGFLLKASEYLKETKVLVVTKAPPADLGQTQGQGGGEINRTVTTDYSDFGV